MILSITIGRFRVSVLLPFLLTILVGRTVAGAVPDQDQGRSPTPAQQSSPVSTGVTIHAVRLDKPLTVDGRLDEQIYQTAEASSDFIQQEPKEGAPATEKTEAWVFFDDRNLYVSARCWDSDPKRDVVTELRRDQSNIVRDENFTVAIDTFLDRRNGFFFQTNPLGAMRDQWIVDNGQNDSWNPIWAVKTARFDGGWTLEMAIPFKSLRYKGAGPQVWGTRSA